MTMCHLSSLLLSSLQNRLHGHVFMYVPDHFAWRRCSSLVSLFHNFSFFSCCVCVLFFSLDIFLAVFFCANAKGTFVRITSFRVLVDHMGMGFMQRVTSSFNCVTGSIRDAGRCYTRTLGQGWCSFSPLGKYSSLSFRRLIRSVLSAGVFPSCVTCICNAVMARTLYYSLFHYLRERQVHFPTDYFIPCPCWSHGNGVHATSHLVVRLCRREHPRCRALLHMDTWSGLMFLQSSRKVQFSVVLATDPSCAFCRGIPIVCHLHL